jgi:hypothetical protein
LWLLTYAGSTQKPGQLLLSQRTSSVFFLNVIPSLTFIYFSIRDTVEPLIVLVSRTSRTTHSLSSCNVHVTTRGWIQLQYWWNYPISFETLSRYCNRLSSSTILVSFNQDVTFVPFQHAPMGCNVHVTTRGWINSRSIGGTIPISLRDIGAVMYVQALPAPTFFWYLSTRMALTLLFPFSTLNRLCTCDYSWMDSTLQYWWNYPNFFESLEPLLYMYRLFQLHFVSFN